MMISIKKARVNVYQENIVTSCLVLFKHGKEKFIRKEKSTKNEGIKTNCTLSLIIIMMNYVFPLS